MTTTLERLGVTPSRCAGELNIFRESLMPFWPVYTWCCGCGPVHGHSVLGSTLRGIAHG